MNREPLTESQKAILTEKLQERLLKAAIPAMVDELKRLTGEEVTFTSVYGLGKKAGNINLVFRIGQSKQSRIPIKVTPEELPDLTFENLLSHSKELFLS